MTGDISDKTTVRNHSFPSNEHLHVFKQAIRAYWKSLKTFAGVYSKNENKMLIQDESVNISLASYYGGHTLEV